MIPDLLGDMYGADIVEMSVKAAMGVPFCASFHEPDGCYATYNLHSDKNGRYVNVVFSPEIEPYIYRKCLYKKPGDPVEFFNNASKCLGIIFMRFPNEETMMDVLENVNKLISVVLG